ncbi:MAG: endopeptidase [Actinomycetota bacterium]|jgi:STE24 endopeptidase
MADTRINTWRRFPAKPEDWFSATEIDKAKRYTRPLSRLNLGERLVGGAVLVALIWTHAVPEWLNEWGIDNWVLRLLVAMLITQAVELVVTLPFGAYRELVYDKRWEFSTQTVGGFASDAAKGLLVGVVVTTALLLPLWALIRATELWWIWGWLVMGVFVVGLGVLAPVLIMPLFNKFTPLDDDDLRADLLGVARTADADVNEIQVSDASRRTRKDNAFVTGMGKTRRLVLFDTILARPVAQIRSVAAHEIGHWKLGHIKRVIPIAAGLLFVNFAVLRLVLGWDKALEWAGVSSLDDPAALPLFLLVFPAGSALTGLISAWVTRAGEREADVFALEVTRDPDAMTAMLHSLHTENLADLAPSWWKRATATHPHAAERLAMAKAWSDASDGKEPLHDGSGS